MGGPLQGRASLHEQAVKKVAREGTKKTPRRRGKGRRPPASRVTTRHWSDDVDERIVAYVESQNVHHSQIQVLGPHEVIIWNRGAPHPG